MGAIVNELDNHIEVVALDGLKGSIIDFPISLLVEAGSPDNI